MSGQRPRPLRGWGEVDADRVGWRRNRDWIGRHTIIAVILGGAFAALIGHSGHHLHRAAEHLPAGPDRRDRTRGPRRRLRRGLGGRPHRCRRRRPNRRARRPPRRRCSGRRRPLGHRLPRRLGRRLERGPRSNARRLPRLRRAPRLARSQDARRRPPPNRLAPLERLRTSPLPPLCEGVGNRSPRGGAVAQRLRGRPALTSADRGALPPLCGGGGSEIAPPEETCASSPFPLSPRSAGGDAAGRGGLRARPHQITEAPHRHFVTPPPAGKVGAGGLTRRSPEGELSRSD